MVLHLNKFLHYSVLNVFDMVHIIFLHETFWDLFVLTVYKNNKIIVVMRFTHLNTDI